jgi:hypothetical protein
MIQIGCNRAGAVRAKQCPFFRETGASSFQRGLMGAPRFRYCSFSQHRNFLR